MLRLLAEAALLIAVAVIAGVAHFQTWVIVVLMASAFAVIAMSEWLASRARFVPPAVAFLPPLEEEGEPAPYVETPAPLGRAALEPAEDTEPTTRLDRHRAVAATTSRTSSRSEDVETTTNSKRSTSRTPAATTS